MVLSNTNFLVSLYEGLLGREFDQGGLEAWRSALNAGTSRNTVIAGFLNSPEFSSQGLSNEQFVTQLYQGILDRNPDLGGLNGWVSALNTGQLSKTDVANGFLYSSEFQQKLVSESNTAFLVSLYEGILGRQFDQGGLEAWRSALNAGTSRRYGNRWLS
jgi:hypothetical protein